MRTLESGYEHDTAKCIGIGLTLGFVFGVALHSYALGLLIGVATGLAICLVQRRRRWLRLPPHFSDRHARA
jgi:hypothetical protein